MPVRELRELLDGLVYGSLQKEYITRLEAELLDVFHREKNTITKNIHLLEEKNKIGKISKKYLDSFFYAQSDNLFGLLQEKHISDIQNEEEAIKNARSFSASRVQENWRQIKKLKSEIKDELLENELYRAYQLIIPRAESYYWTADALKKLENLEAMDKTEKLELRARIKQSLEKRAYEKIRKKASALFGTDEESSKYLSKIANNYNKYNTQLDQKQTLLEGVAGVFKEELETEKEKLNAKYQIALAKQDTVVINNISQRLNDIEKALRDYRLLKNYADQIDKEYKQDLRAAWKGLNHINEISDIVSPKYKEIQKKYANIAAEELSCTILNYGYVLNNSTKEQSESLKSAFEQAYTKLTKRLNKQPSEVSMYSKSGQFYISAEGQKERLRLSKESSNNSGAKYFELIRAIGLTYE